MANPTFVQANNSTTYNSGTSSVSATYTGAQTSGNCNVVLVFNNSGNSLPAVEQITDTSGNIYLLASFSFINAWGSQNLVYVAWNIAAANANANTVTAVIKGATTAYIIIAEYSGAIDCSTSAANAGTGTSATAGNLTTFNANETLVALVANTVTATFTTVGSGGTPNQRQQAGSTGLFMFDMACGAAGSYGITWNNFSGTNASVTWEVCLISLSSVAIAPQSRLLVPPLGYDTWRAFGASCTAAQAKSNVDKMVSLGLLSAGYKLFNVSDVLYNSRTSGNLVTNTTLFPAGDTDLYNYIKNAGLQIAQYLGPGATGCNSFPGSDTFETNDANKFAGVAVKYLMYDSCTDFGNSEATRVKYNTMRTAINASSAPFAFMVSAPVFENLSLSGSQTWGKSIGADEYWALIDQGTPKTWAKIIQEADTDLNMAGWQKPGWVMISDFLGTGNGTLTVAEGRSHYCLHCIQPSAQFISCDLTSIGASDLATLLNSELITVQQDPLVSAGQRVSRIPTGADTVEVWTRKLQGSDFAAMLWNRDSVSNNITVTWSMIGQTGALFAMRDLINHTNLGTSTTGYTATVASHDVAFILIFDPLSPYAPINLKVSPLNVATWTDVEPSTANMFFDSAADPNFTQSYVSTPIAQILPPGNRTLTVPVINKYYRVKVSRLSGTAFSSVVSAPVTVPTTGLYIAYNTWGAYQVWNLAAGVDYGSEIQSVISGPYANYNTAILAQVQAAL